METKNDFSVIKSIWKRRIESLPTAFQCHTTDLVRLAYMPSYPIPIFLFTTANQNLDRLKQLREWFPHINMNVEFRNYEWIRKDVIESLKKEDLGFVCVVKPKVKGLIGKVLVTTSQVSYLRIYGRNASKWYGGEGPERYDYLYNHNELTEWLLWIMEFEKSSANTVIAFNNHPKGKVVENALIMADILRHQL